MTYSVSSSIPRDWVPDFLLHSSRLCQHHQLNYTWQQSIFCSQCTFWTGPHWDLGAESASHSSQSLLMLMMIALKIMAVAISQILQGFFFYWLLIYSCRWHCSRHHHQHRHHDYQPHHLRHLLTEGVFKTLCLARLGPGWGHSTASMSIVVKKYKKYKKNTITNTNPITNTVQLQIQI